MAIQKTKLNARKRKLKTKQAENEAIRYIIDWSAQLDTDTIKTSTWSSEDSGVTIATEGTLDNQAYATLSGDVGCYRVVNKVTTTLGLKSERYIDLTIMDNSKRCLYDYWPG